MSNLKYCTQEKIEDLFDMKTGYVLDFGNVSFQRFVKGNIGIDIYNDSGYQSDCSKANKLRQIFDDESNYKVIHLVNALLEHYEDYKLKNNQLNDYDKMTIKEIRNGLEELAKENDEKIEVDEGLDEIIQKISIRNIRFNEMVADEKLSQICNVIEYLLKKDNKFISIKYDDISVGFVNENNVIKLRKKLQCFRHSSKESINERRNYTEEQKKFMIEYGIAVCNLIYNEIKK